MKATLRIATKDVYCYIEAETEGTPHEIVEQYGELYRAYHGRNGAGLPPKEWDTFVQNMVAGKSNHTETIEKLSEEQRTQYNTLKRAIQRENYKLKTSKE